MSDSVSMNETPLTEEELFLLNNDDLKKRVWAASPKIEGNYFTPDLLNPKDHPVLKEVKALRLAWQIRRKRLVNLQKWLIPALILLPTALFAVAQAYQIAGLWFTISLTLTVGYFWGTGKVTTWRGRRFENAVAYVERETQNVIDQKASAWAKNRYVLHYGDIEWSSYGSEFRLKDIHGETHTYRWEERTTDGYQLIDLSTNEEPPLKADEKS